MVGHKPARGGAPPLFDPLRRTRMRHCPLRPGGIRIPPPGSGERVTDGARTRDPKDHNLVLYQLSYGHHQIGSPRKPARRIKLGDKAFSVKPSELPAGPPPSMGRGAEGVRFPAGMPGCEGVMQKPANPGLFEQSLTTPPQTTVERATMVQWGRTPLRWR